jgi:RNA polymerase sigma-70 factor (ECF subfamily)
MILLSLQYFFNIEFNFTIFGAGSILGDHKKSMSALHDQYYFMLNQFASNTSDEDLSEKLRSMNIMISKLPTKTKAIFTLSKQSGLSNIEISESLNISIKTVEGHITKAFKLLREEVEKLS